MKIGDMIQVIKDYKITLVFDFIGALLIGTGDVGFGCLLFLWSFFAYRKENSIFKLKVQNNDRKKFLESKSTERLFNTC